ncbi:MAG: hypothetical protein ACRD0L_03410 [Acidimicrobiales bacterium]
MISPAVARADQRLVAHRALRAATARVGPLSYARIDVVDDLAGAPLVLELELVEPSLFLEPRDGAAEQLARHLRHVSEQNTAL